MWGIMTVERLLNLAHLVVARWLLHILALLLTIFLGLVVYNRVTFQGEYYLWSEGAVMINLMKLENGEPVYGPAVEANSSIYSPSASYTAFAVLKPLDLATDLRAVRAVVVAVGVLGCVLAALSSALLAGVRLRSAGPWLITSTCVAILVRAQNPSFDALHPDNWHILHATFTLLLCILALQSGRLGWGIAAMLVAGTGILAKQTAALAPVGVGLALLLGHRWSRRDALILAGAGVLSLGVCAALLLGPENSRFWAYELAADRATKPLKIWLLIVEIIEHPYHLALIALVFPALLHFMRRAQRPLWLAWIGVGIFEVAPALPAFIKDGGVVNNLGIVDLWLFIGMWALWGFGAMGTRLIPPPGESSRLTAYRVNPAYVALVFVLLVYPVKKAPPADLRDYVDDLHQHVQADVDAGQQVLLTYATTPLIEAGVTEPPRDQAHALLDLERGGYTGSTGAWERIADQYYDRVYVNLIELPEGFLDHVRAYYHEVARIPQPDSVDDLTFEQGFFTRLMPDVVIFAPNE